MCRPVTRRLGDAVPATILANPLPELRGACSRPTPSGTNNCIRVGFTPPKPDATVLKLHILGPEGCYSVSRRVNRRHANRKLSKVQRTGTGRVCRSSGPESRDSPKTGGSRHRQWLCRTSGTFANVQLQNAQARERCGPSPASFS